MTDTIIMRGAHAITDPRLGASGVIPAGAVVIIFPIIVVYMIFQRKFIESLTAGSTK